MFDEVLAVLTGAVIAMVKIKNPSPRMYVWAFFIAAFAMWLVVFIMFAISAGFLPAVRSFGEDFVNPVGFCTFFLGGGLGVCFLKVLSGKKS